MIEVKHLILIVGSNPFPNYLVAEYFQPKRISFVYTEQTKAYKNDLINVLKRKDWAKGASIGGDNNDICIKDARDPNSIRTKLKDNSKLFHKDVYLDYTSGTKAMSAQILRYFYETGNDSSRAFYLNDELGVICFDQEEREPINIEEGNIRVSLRDIFEIHGLEPPKNSYWKKYYKDNDFENSDKNEVNEEEDDDEELIDIIDDINKTFIENNIKQKLVDFGFKLINKNNLLDWKNFDFNWLNIFAKELLKDSELRNEFYVNSLRVIRPKKYREDLKDKAKKSFPLEIREVYKKEHESIKGKPLDEPKNFIFSQINEKNEKLKEFDNYITNPISLETINDSTKDQEEINKENGKIKGAWTSFFEGTWFEVWLERLIVNNILNINNKINEIHQSVKCYKKKAKNNFAEIDLCFVIGRRFYALSLTTSTDKEICKGKLFEISVRARQLAGDHARTALICLVDDEEVMFNLKNNMKIGFSPNQANQPKVFGLKDVFEWAGLDYDKKDQENNEKEPNYKTLKDFFEK